MAQRIAISGSAGVGKSTLARALAERLGVAYLPEGMREFLESSRVDIHDLGAEGLRALVLRLWEERRELEERHAAFVADRASYDFAAFWMFYGFAKDDDATSRLFAEALRADRYSQVVVLPWGRIPLLADGVRSTNRYAQLHVQSMIVGLCAEFGPSPLWVHEVELRARVEAVLARLAD
jgi:nicotinamide riboside kinase